MFMNFAEEITPPVNPETPPVDPNATPPAEPGTVPAEPAPVDPNAAPADPNAAPAEPAVPEDPQRAKIDALQNSLDAALDELSKGDEPVPIEPTPADPAPVADPKPAAPTPAVPTTSAPAAPKGDEAWKQEIESIKKGQEDFQNNTIKELEGMKLKDEMIGLTSEVQAAITQYPDVDPNRILLEVESGSELSVTDIAKGLQEGHQALVDKIKAEQEEKIKTALELENEGKIKVPQSSGTSSTPNGTPDQPGAPVHTKAAQDAAWASATKAAKANLQ